MKIKEFYGRNIEQMPKLIKEGYKLISVKELMELRLKQKLNDVYVDAGDAIIYHPKGNVKIVRNAEFMKKLNSKSKLENGGLILTESQYKKIKGKEFTRKQIEKHTEKYLTKKEILKNPVWLELAGNDKILLKNYVDLIINKTNEKKVMYLWIESTPTKITGRLWCVCRSGDGSRSGADGRDDLDDGYGRLVGVATESHIIKKEFTKEEIKYLKDFVKKMKELNKEEE